MESTRIKINIPSDIFDTGYETRKLTVTKNEVLKNIKDVLGSFKCISYNDEDGDNICCYLEREATEAVFVDIVTSFMVVNTDKNHVTEAEKPEDTLADTCGVNAEPSVISHTENQHEDSNIIDKSDSEDSDEDYQLPTSSTKRTPAFKNFERNLDPTFFTFTCDDEEKQFTISCLSCNCTFTTTAKRGLSRVDKHIASWGHKEQSGASVEKEKQLKESVDKEFPGIFVLKNSCFICKFCNNRGSNASIEASAKCHGSPMVRCASHVNSKTHKRNVGEIKVKPLTSYFTKASKSSVSETSEKFS